MAASSSFDQIFLATLLGLFAGLIQMLLRGSDTDVRQLNNDAEVARMQQISVPSNAIADSASTFERRTRRERRRRENSVEIDGDGGGPSKRREQGNKGGREAEAVKTTNVVRKYEEEADMEQEEVILLSDGDTADNPRLDQMLHMQAVAIESPMEELQADMEREPESSAIEDQVIVLKGDGELTMFAVGEEQARVEREQGSAAASDTVVLKRDGDIRGSSLPRELQQLARKGSRAEVAPSPDHRESIPHDEMMSELIRWKLKKCPLCPFESTSKKFGPKSHVRKCRNHAGCDEECCKILCDGCLLLLPDVEKAIEHYEETKHSEVYWITRCPYRPSSQTSSSLASSAILGLNERRSGGKK